MRLRTKIILLAVLPLLGAMLLIALAVVRQEQDLARRQNSVVRAAYINAAEDELRRYMALALSTISPLYNTLRDDDEIKQQVLQRLAALDYGADGYFFLYDFNGVNLMHPRQPELVGRNLMNMRDASGAFSIRQMAERARAGGGFVNYMWNKPSTQQPAAKIAYVTPLARWNWWFGTGVYVDDIDSVLVQLDRDLSANAAATLRLIAGASVLAIALVVVCGLYIGLLELRSADAQLTLLARQVVSSQEDERAHLSRELHDGTSQTLVSVKLLVEAALERLSPDAAEGRTLRRAVDRLEQALVEVRGMSHRLRPEMLDTLGLPAALEQLGREMCPGDEPAFQMRIEGGLRELPDGIKTVLFRVTQEALTNIRKHARASQVRLELDFLDGDGVRLAIEDDGQGFDAEDLLAHPRRGIGLRNMRERLAAIGGTLDLVSRSGRTAVRAVVPESAIRRFAKM
jgi:two-component system NarL family sensor kinase